MKGFYTTNGKYGLGPFWILILWDGIGLIARHGLPKARSSFALSVQSTRMEGIWGFGIRNRCYGFG